MIAQLYIGHWEISFLRQCTWVEDGPISFKCISLSSRQWRHDISFAESALPWISLCSISMRKILQSHTYLNPSASGGGATKRPSHVLYMGVSYYSHQCADGTLNSTLAFQNAAHKKWSYKGVLIYHDLHVGKPHKMSRKKVMNKGNVDSNISKICTYFSQTVLLCSSEIWLYNKIRAKTMFYHGRP